MRRRKGPRAAKKKEGKRNDQDFELHANALITLLRLIADGALRDSNRPAVIPMGDSVG